MANATADPSASATRSSCHLPRFEVEEGLEDSLHKLVLTLRFEHERQAVRMLRSALDALEPPRQQRKPGESYADYLLSSRWAATRQRALMRAGWKCQTCSAKDRLHVHHNTYDRRGNERDTDLIVLCKRCHSLYEGVVS